MPRKFENEIPVDEDIVVLDLLDCRREDCTIRVLHCWRGQPSYVQIDHTHEHSDSDVRRFLVAEGAARRLAGKELVRGTPKWGYTELRELVISDYGRRVLESARREFGIDSWNTHAERWLRKGRW